MVEELKEIDKEFLNSKYINLGYSKKEAEDKVKEHISLIIIPTFPVETFK